MAKKAKSSKSKSAGTSKSRSSRTKQSKKDAERVLKTGPIVRRPRQARLPGVEEDRGSKAIDNAAYDYVEARDARMGATVIENQRATKLIALVKKERPGQKAYKHTVGGEVLNVSLSVKDPTEKVKVKISPVDQPELGEGESAEEDAGDVVAMDSETAAEA